MLFIGVTQRDLGIHAWPRWKVTQVLNQEHSTFAENVALNFLHLHSLSREHKNSTYMET